MIPNANRIRSWLKQCLKSKPCLFSFQLTHIMFQEGNFPIFWLSLILWSSSRYIAYDKLTKQWSQILFDSKLKSSKTKILVYLCTTRTLGIWLSLFFWSDHEKIQPFLTSFLQVRLEQFGWLFFILVKFKQWVGLLAAG